MTNGVLYDPGHSCGPSGGPRCGPSGGPSGVQADGTGKEAW